MKILVISGTFHPEAGGPPTYLYHLLPELVRRGHIVSVVTYGDVETGYTYPYRVTRVSRRQSIPRRLWHITRQIVQQGQEADVLFVSDYGLPAALANVWLRKPVVLKIVTDFAWEFSVRHGWVATDTLMDDFQTGNYGWRVALLKAMQRFYARVARRVIVPSDYIRSIVTGWGIAPERVRVIYNAPRLDSYTSLPDKNTLRVELKLDAPTIVCVARLTAWKGIDGVIRALPAVRQAIADARLVIIGDGPQRSRLEKLTQASPARDDIHFTGQLPHAEAARYLKAADVFALFSTYEGLPHTVLEAFAAGTPVVASAAGGTPETISDGESGLLVATGDESALAAALVSALSERALAERLASGGQAALERFSPAGMIDATETLLRAVASGNAT